MFKSITVIDVNVNRSVPKGYEATAWSMPKNSWLSDNDTYWQTEDAFATMAQSIKMIPQTARTNVMLRDSRGRLVSFRDPQVPARIRDAVESLPPLPL